MKNLVRESEFIAELSLISITLTGRMIRNYVVKGILPIPIKIPGQGNVLFYDKDWIERVKIIQQLVKEGESLDSIKLILSSARASDHEILDYISSRDYLDVRRYAIKLLKEGKSLNEVMKNQVISAKEKFRELFDKRYGKGRYQRMADDFFHILSKYKQLYPINWTKDDILEYFGITAEDIDFSDRKAVRIFKMNFFKKLGQFLREKHKELEEDIQFCDQSVRGYEGIINKR